MGLRLCPRGVRFLLSEVVLWTHQSYSAAVQLVRSLVTAGDVGIGTVAGMSAHAFRQSGILREGLAAGGAGVGAVAGNLDNPLPQMVHSKTSWPFSTTRPFLLGAAGPLPCTALDKSSLARFCPTIAGALRPERRPPPENLLITRPA